MFPPRITLYRLAAIASVAVLPLARLSAQTSTSSAIIVAHGSSTACGGVPNGPAATTSSTCSVNPVTTPAYAAVGTASSASANATRTSNAQGSISQAMYLPYSATGTSTQNSSVSFTGTPTGSPTSLLFHFNTTTNASVSGATDASAGNYASWSLVLTGGQSTTSTASVADTVFGNAATGVFHSVNATATGTGFNFLLPFDPNGGLFSFAVTPNAESLVQPGTPASPGPSGNSSIFETLMGIDAVDANGVVIGQATFNATNGTATITFAPSQGPPVTSTPEPGSLALLGTGLVGLVPAVRRRIR